MKIIKNTSHYDTKKLKSMFCFIHSQLAKHEGRLPQWKSLQITCMKHKQLNSYSGWAYLGKVYGEGADMHLRMGRDISIKANAQLFAHELMHSYGYTHSQFNTDPLTPEEVAQVEAKFTREDILSPKAFHVPKKGISYKQKCYDLMKEFKWLSIDWHNNEWVREIEVIDNRDDCLCYEDDSVNCTCDEVFDMRMEWRAVSWKKAYNNAMLHILGDIDWKK